MNPNKGVIKLKKYNCPFSLIAGKNRINVLGINTDLNESKFYEYVKIFMKNGATILGGCCETRPSHIKEMVQFK